MADDEMMPAEGAEPPKKLATLSLKPQPKPDAADGAPNTGLKPGLKLPPKPVAGVSALRPGLKLPAKPGAPAGALRPGLKLPAKPGATVAALRPGLKLPPKPVISVPKPGILVTTPTLATAKKPTGPVPAMPDVKPEPPVATAPEAKPVVAEMKPVVAEMKPVEPEVKPVVPEVKPVEPVAATPEAKPVVTEMKPVEPVAAAPEAKPVASAPVSVSAPKPMLKPGLKLPTAGALKPGLKLPTAGAFKPGLKLPTQGAVKSGLKLPPKPVIRKPGATVLAKPLPKPVAVDVQGVGKLPTVGAEAVARTDATPAVPQGPKPMEALKGATQKLKGITQEIPQPAILHKTGIIAEGPMSDAQKEAVKHKTARISLSDAMGVAPVKEEPVPMKTIRIKRPVDLAHPTSSLTPAAQPPSGDAAKTIVIPKAAPVPEPATSEAAKPAAGAAEGAASEATITQRKTLKIARPGVGIRPAGKFGAKRPVTPAKPAAAKPAADAKPAAEAEVADIPDIPSVPTGAPVPHVATVSDVPAWATTLSVVVQIAACGVIGALAWFLYENAQLATFCGGLGWGV